jgi:4a-hydroxytetrahydrobiopterin dehydratase
MAFVNRVAELANAADHHPDILIRYDHVVLTLSSHDSGGLTERDFKLAAAIDA